MDLKKQLSHEELQQYQKMLQLLTSDDQTQQLCLKYFIAFKQQTSIISTEKLPIALKCAFFMAQKSQKLYSLNGQLIKGIGLSLNQLLKAHKLADIMITLKQLIKKVKINDQQAQHDLNGIVQEISFLIHFHLKFQKTIQKLQLKQKFGQAFGYIKIFTSFTWLLYVEAKNKILHRSLQLIENTCMLAHIISFMLIYSWDYVRPTIFMKGEKKLTDESTWKEVSLLVKEKILEMFLIKNMEVYRHMAKSFEDYFHQMVEGGIIKVSSGKVDFLSPQHINPNYKRIDHYYQKNLNPHDLDQRVFFKDRVTNLTPSKFTPFSKQGYVNKLTKVKLGGNLQNRQNFNSHRILTYDMIDKQDSQSQKIAPLVQMKLPKNVLQSPSTVKVPLICSTPISTGMQMYNYLNEKTRKVRDKVIDPKIEHLLDQIFQRQKRQFDKNSRQMKKTLISTLYILSLQQYLSKNNQDYHNDKIRLALLAMSIQLVFFVSNINLSFDIIESQLKIQVIQQWKALDFFLKFDKSMPSTLKLHLLDLQVNLVSIKVWKDRNLMKQLYNCANGQQISNSSIQRCFKRVLHQVAYQITQLAQPLKIDDRISQIIFQTMKQIFLTKIQLLENRHIDQFIICSIYANCKIARLDMKFNQIKQKYQENNPHNRTIHQQIICQVNMKDFPKVDIIEFYNKVFIPNLKGFIFTLKDQNYIPNHCRKNTVLQSPLKAIIPRELAFRQPKKQANVNVKPSMTPLLYAYNESPILKYELGAFKGPIHSKKVINFDEEQEKLLKQCEQIQQRPDSFIQTTDFISKKFSKKQINDRYQINSQASTHLSPRDLHTSPSGNIAHTYSTKSIIPQRALIPSYERR